jgi:hypothetical protein
MTPTNFNLPINKDSAADLIAQDILNIINRLFDQLKIDANLSYSKLNGIAVHLQVKRGRVSPNSADWFKSNFEKHGFSIDASSYLSSATGPSIDLNIIIDPLSEKEVLPNLLPFLADTIRHEIEHCYPDSVKSAQQTNSKSSYRYFLSSSEIPAQVAGLSMLARKKGISLKQAIADYLSPFVDSGFMTGSQFEEILATWLGHSAAN